MEYEILNKDNILKYIQSISSIQNYFGSDDLYIDEIRDSNLNYVFSIKSIPKPKKALILKQALPYLKRANKSYPFSKARMTYEIKAFKEISKITSEYIPKIFHMSENMSCIIMEYLENHTLMRQGMIKKIIFPNFSEHISTYLAQNLFKTSSLYLNSKEKKDLVNKFNSNTELRKLSEDFTFTFAFMKDEINDVYVNKHKAAIELFQDIKFKKAILKYKYKFMTQSDALIHGNLHAGSIMINENKTNVIDPEFAFVGPFAFDVGTLIASLITSYTSHVVKKSEDKYKEWILKTIEEVLIKFEDKFLALWNEQEESSLIKKAYLNEFDLLDYKKEFILDIFQDALAFAGCKIVKSVFEVSSIIDITDQKVKDIAINMTLEIAKTFLKKNKEITKVSTVIYIIKDKTK